MDADDVALVRADAATLAVHGPAVAREFYDALFEIAPDTEALFPVEMAAQQAKFLDELDALVELATSASAGSATFGERTAALGRRHEEYGTTPAHFAPAGEALLAALELHVPGWDESHRDTWARLLHLVSQSMIHGAADADATLHDRPGGPTA